MSEVLLNLLSLYLILGVGSLVSIIVEMVWQLRGGVPEGLKNFLRSTLQNPIGWTLSFTVVIVATVMLWPMRLVQHSKK
jgi:hypothetical protein